MRVQNKIINKLHVCVANYATLFCETRHVDGPSELRSHVRQNWIPFH